MIAQTKKRIKVSQMTKIAMMSTISFILMQFQLTIPIFPEFLKIDLSDLPALIGAFAMGPFAGLAIEAIKNILHTLQSSTFVVGEIANFVIGSSLVIPSALIYKRHKSKQSAIIGLVVGTITMTIVGALANYFVLIPLYSTFMPMDAIIKMGSVAFKGIDSVFTLVMFGIVPFNLFKGIILSVLTLILYKHISPILHKQH